MVWRSIVINRPSHLRREHFSLVVDQEEEARVPFEDIAVIVLNNREITLTHPVLSACAEYGIGLYAMGHNHHPSGVFLPFLSHRRSTRMLRLQLALSKPIAKQTWAAIVRRKIHNQAACLRLTGLGDHERLSSYARRVRSGDTGNMEAQASAYYFRQLFGRYFQRSQECWVNSALDYGYAIIRGAIARSLVAHGLLPSIGIFHSSEQNAFNLADDLIEAYRPLVDMYAAQHRPIEDRELSPKDKASLVGLLHVDVTMPRGSTSVISSIDQATESLVRVLEGGLVTLLELPILVGLHMHRSDI